MAKIPKTILHIEVNDKEYNIVNPVVRCKRREARKAAKAQQLPK